MATGLSLVAGGGNLAPGERAASPGRPAETLPSPAFAGEGGHAQHGGGVLSSPEPLRQRSALPFPQEILGRRTLSELFAASPRDSGWAGFLLAQLDRGRPLLWIQERMAILESGRAHPPGLGVGELIHVEARNARDVLWAMEEGLRCPGLGAVVGEIWSDPAALDFTATRRLAVAAERHGVAAFLIRLGGHANLSGARMRWRVASAPSLVHPLNPKAPGAAAWDAELFRARGFAPGRWAVAHDEDRFHLLAETGDRALDEDRRIA